MAAHCTHNPQLVNPIHTHYEQMDHLVTEGKQGENPGKLSNPIGVAIDENSNYIFVTEYDPARVSIFSESCEFLNTVTHQLMQHPYGIAIHLNNLYVTDTGVHGVFHFKLEAFMRLNTKLLGKGSDVGEFVYPRQLTVSTKGDVLVADCHNHRIQIMDGSLRFQRSITHDSMHYPEDVQISHNEVYVLSWIDSPCVHVFSFSGEKISSFITLGQGMQVARPCFFRLDSQKNVIISDALAHSVKVFSPNGTLLHKIDEFQGGFHYCPLGLALSQQKIVVISPFDTFQIKIFY